MSTLGSLPLANASEALESNLANISIKRAKHDLARASIVSLLAVSIISSRMLPTQRTRSTCVKCQ